MGRGTPRDFTDLLPVLRHWRNAEQEAEWRTPWESGEEAILGDWEMVRLDESVARMRAILAPNGFSSNGTRRRA